jgi:stage II sporulation protein AA (anti-sigma F factor antagonist)
MTEDTSTGLTVHTERSGDRTVLTATGAIDYENSDALRAVLESVVTGARNPRVVLDLQRVEAVDSTGLALLIAADGWTRDRGGWLRLAGPTDQVQRLIDTTNLDRLLRLYPSLAEALDRSGPE